MSRISSSIPSQARNWSQIYLGVALTTLATLILELSLTRIFSVVFYYHFAFLAISIALFGLGVGGVFSYVIAARPGDVFRKLGALAAVALAFVFSPVRHAAAEDEAEYTFKVHNTTKDTIKSLLVSEDGKEYSHFDLGKEGIKPDETAKLKWDKSTNKKGCKWYIKAVFADDSKTESKKFDFCEEELELDF